MPTIVLARGLRYSLAGRLFKVNEPQDVDEATAKVLMAEQLYDGQGMSTPFKLVDGSTPAVAEPVAPGGEGQEKPTGGKRIVVGGSKAPAAPVTE